MKQMYDYDLGVKYRNLGLYNQAVEYLYNSIKISNDKNYYTYLELLEVAILAKNKLVIDEVEGELISLVNINNFNYINNELVSLIIDLIFREDLFNAYSITAVGYRLACKINDDKLIYRYSKMREQLISLINFMEEDEIILQVRLAVYYNIISKIIRSSSTLSIIKKNKEAKILSKLKKYSLRNYGNVLTSIKKVKEQYENLYYGSEFYEIEFNIIKRQIKYIERCNDQYNKNNFYMEKI